MKHSLESLIVTKWLLLALLGTSNCLHSFRLRDAQSSLPAIMLLFAAAADDDMEKLAREGLILLILLILDDSADDEAG